MGKKATKFEVEQRIDMIFEAMAMGYNRRQIIRNFSRKWGLKERQIENYITKCYDIQKKIYNDDREKLLKNQQLKLDRLYQKAFSDEKLKTCVAIIKEQNELMRLKDIGNDKTENNHNDTFIIIE